jgi:hypothetical protein
MCNSHIFNIREIVYIVWSLLKDALTYILMEYLYNSSRDNLVHIRNLLLNLLLENFLILGERLRGKKILIKSHINPNFLETFS